MIEIGISFVVGLFTGSLSVYFVMNRNTQSSAGDKSPNIVADNVDYKAK